MPIIGKPLLVLGSLAGVSLLGAGGYFGISHLVSLNSQKSTESNSPSPEREAVNDGLQDENTPTDSPISEVGQDVAGEREEDVERSPNSEDTQITTQPTANLSSSPLKDESSNAGEDITENAEQGNLPKSDVDDTRDSDNSRLEDQKSQNATSGIDSSGDQQSGVSSTGSNDVVGSNAEASTSINSAEDNSASLSSEVGSEQKQKVKDSSPTGEAEVVDKDGAQGESQLNTEGEGVQASSGPSIVSESQEGVKNVVSSESSDEISSGSTGEESLLKAPESTTDQS